MKEHIEKQDKSIMVIGSLNYDVILKQKRLPQPGETFTADSINFSGGGKGANQAVQCAKLGANTYMLGNVGNDYYGEYLLEELEKYGVNTDYINKVNTNTGVGIVNALEDGSVFATISTGANYTLSKADIDRVEECIAKCKIVILQLEIPVDVVEYAIEVAARHRCFIILNAAPAKEVSEYAMSLVDCLIVNESEASFYLGTSINDVSSAYENCEKLFEKIKSILIITLGKNGSLLFDGKQKHYIPAKKVQAIETTGAGDSYIGAFAYMLLREASYYSATDFATTVAGVTVTRIGAQPSMPTLEEMNQHHRESESI